MNIHRFLAKTRFILLAVFVLQLAFFPAGSSGLAVQASSKLDLAYVRDGDIYLASIQDDGILSDRQLTYNGANNNPAWSPDGRYLSYQNNGGGNPEIVILDVVAGSNAWVIPGACCAAWSPAGDLISYIDLSSGDLVTSTPDNSYRSVRWPNVFGTGTPFGRMAWAADDTIFLAIARGDVASQVWGVDASGSAWQVYGPGIEDGMWSPSDVLSAPAASLSGDLALTVDTGMLGFAPGGPVIYAGYGGNGPAFGRWQVEMGIGDQASWAPEGGRFAWEQWVSCNDAGIDAPGFCKGGIGIVDLYGQSQTMLMWGTNLSQPAWRPAVPAGLPTSTPTLQPATSTPRKPTSTPQPVSDPVLCGRLDTITVDSGMTAYPQAVLVPCGEGRLVEVGPLGGWGDGELYRYSQPVIEPLSPYKSDLGMIDSRLVSSGKVQAIASCQVCGLSAPKIVQNNSLVVTAIDWQPQPPKAMEELTLVLKMQAKGSTIATAPYVVDLTFGTDFPYDYIHYTFDSEDPVSGAHLSPRSPQPGSYDLEVTGLRFPMTYAGSLAVTVRLKESEEASNSAANFNVDVSGKAWNTCTGALAKGLNLLAEVPLPQAAQVETTILFLDHMERLEICGDNPTCLAEAQASYEQATFKSMVKITSDYAQNFAVVSDLLAQMPGVRLAARTKKVVELGLDPIKCGDFLWDFVKQALQKANQETDTNLVNGFLTASPVYPLVTTADGLQTGFLPDGSLVEQIPDAKAVQLGEERLVLVPAELAASLQVSGYARGTMDLYAYLAGETGRALNLTYQDVPVENGTYMELNDVPAGGDLPANAYRSGMTLEVTTNGKTDELSPDQIEQIDPSGQSQLVDRTSGSGQNLVMLVLAGALGAALTAAIILLAVPRLRRRSR